MTFYFGSTGGGVWRTDDGGSTWRNISDGYFGGSIGSIAIAPSDPNVIYVGGGEKTLRGNFSHGDGIWKSVDGGETWEFAGLEDSRQVPRVRVHPKDPNTVFVAALGHASGPKPATWRVFVLLMEVKTGNVSCLQMMKPVQSTWSSIQITRVSFTRLLGESKGITLASESGGDGSALWKSIDGGDTWTDISRNEGLPKKSTLGIIGVTVSPVDSNRLWAMVEANDGGLFRSDDAGKTWKKINDERKLRQRAWYYTRVYADPKTRTRFTS